jgi:rhamnose transport system ATP-binding protein
MSGTKSVLSLTGARKTFGAVVALDNGQIDLVPGEIHALVGENGAGKSTLVKILAGVHAPDKGEFVVKGKPVSFKGVAESKAAGISVIYQEPTLFPDLTVSENIFVGRQPKGALGLMSRKLMNQATNELFVKLGISMSPDRRADGLSIADQQIIEIAKAISLDAEILVMDEPTAALSGAEVERLFSVARSLRDQGVAILFISHRFDEIFSLTDRITVMRDGSYVSTHKTKDTSETEIIKEMVGRDISALFPKLEAAIGETVLEVSGLSSLGKFSNIDIQVSAGEIVSLAGLVGAGRTEVARAIFGIDPIDSGSINFLGKELRKHTPTQSISAGMGFVPEDRRKQGLVLELPIRRNVTLTLIKKLASFGLIPPKREREAAETWTKKLQVKSENLGRSASTLSGGNQQKVVLAKWMAVKPRLLIVDEPTRGIDVGTKAEVHRLLSALAQEGVGVLMISSELPEVLGMADRIYVMSEGRITQELSRTEASAEKVMAAATAKGVKA